MPRYSNEFKYSVIAKMMPPHNQSVSDVARETGLSEGTLFKWKKQAKAKGIPVPGSESQPERWSPQDAVCQDSCRENLRKILPTNLVLSPLDQCLYVLD